MSQNPKDPKDLSTTTFQPPPQLVAQVQAAATGSRTHQEHSSSRRSDGHVSENASSMLPDVHETPIEHVPPPAYSQTYGTVDLSQGGVDTKARVANDGRVDIHIDCKSHRLSNLLVPALRNQLHLQHGKKPPVLPPGYVPPALGGLPGQTPPPPLNVVIHVVGSRGDVQPFVSLGQVLKGTYGHRVRLATHPVFKSLIEENGLEFFSIGGDPAELMAFMVKNPGLMPGMDALRSGDVGKRRKGMYEIVKGCWRSCFEAGDGTGVEISDKNFESRTSFDSGISVTSELDSKPFVADAIIANPPSFAHVHIAEKMGIPLHLMFTMPWSPTQAFPHPLANIQSSNADTSMTNFISYALVEMMTWQGLGDVINRFREKSLGLEPVSLLWAPGMASRLRIPYTYCWSPALIPKPKDWGPHISISGFYFLSLASNYEPPADLAVFLEAGEPPIYIGFGSIVVDDPTAMTELIFDAVKKTGKRALVSKGWGGLGVDTLGIPEGVFMLGNIPHDWLFKHVSCVVHHGGAGTTAAGIALGKPTVIVPFFGDQPFWGAMVAKAGAGPPPIPHKQLTSQNLADAISEALKPTALHRAQELGQKIGSEKGADVGAKSFHDALEYDKLRCSLAPSRAAVWRVRRTETRLSAFAATVLANQGLLEFSELKLYRPREYDTEDGPWDPISGGATALLGTIGSLMMGVADFPIEVVRAIHSIKPTDSSPGTKTPVTSPKILPTRTNSDAHSMSGSTVPSGTSSSGSAILTPDAAERQLSSQSTRDSSTFSSQTTDASGPSQKSTRPPTNPPDRQVSFDTALGAGKSVGKIVGAGLKSPMDFTLGLARGFHNAPKLYGDESVRQADKVTDFQSGLKAAGKEFGFGFYDGVSGLVTQPLEGAKKEGVVGLIKGFGKGIGGVVLKPGAAIWGLPGYTFKGIYKELQKHLGSSVQNYVIAARTAQGYDEWNSSSEAERLDVVARWQNIQVELSKQKWPQRARSRSPQGLMKTMHMSFDERKEYAERKKKLGKKVSKVGVVEIPSVAQGETSPPSNSSLSVTTAAPSHLDFETSIRDSVAATSMGDAAEDELIERAIRASITELQSASRDHDEDALERAIQASLAEASHARHSLGSHDNMDDEHRKQLEAAIRLSIRGNHPPPLESKVHESHGDMDDSGIDTDDDSNIKAALEQSKRMAGPVSLDADEEMKKVLEQSRLHHGITTNQKSEEEIVIEYIKKQSLAEEQHRQKIDGSSSGFSDNGGSLGTH